MASKMIAIKEELYEKLSKLKKPGQSFSDVIADILNHIKTEPLRHFAIGKDLDSKDLDDFEDFLKKNREKSQINQKLIEL